MSIISPKPIETRYAGCRFRSRLEARWAVFFDHLGIKWEYEPEGYVIGGRPYLPDFWLPENQTWVEVKGSDHDSFEGEHVHLCRGLADATDHPVVLLIGPPEARFHNRFTPNLDPNSFTAALFCDYAPHLVVADHYWFQFTDTRSDDGALIFTCDRRRIRKAFGDGLFDAITAARSARFEHGEAS